MIARGNVRKILKKVMQIQDYIGAAHGSHANDRDPNGFEKAQKALEAAERLCIEITGMYEPLKQRDVSFE